MLQLLLHGRTNRLRAYVLAHLELHGLGIPAFISAVSHIFNTLFHRKPKTKTQIASPFLLSLVLFCPPLPPPSPAPKPNSSSRTRRRPTW